MKYIRIFFFLILFGLSTLSTAYAETNVPIYRLYNSSSGEHLYTPDYNEVSVLTSSWTTGWKDEGLGWVEPQNGQGVYRLCNNKNGSHLYTTDTNEVSVLTSGTDWVSDFNGQPIFYSGGFTPVYRVYHPITGQHHLTTDENEYTVLGTQGWNQEGQALNCAGITYAEAVNVDSVLSNPQSGWSKLDYTGKQVYGKLCIGVERLERSISVREFQISKEQLEQIRDQFRIDHPEYIQLDISNGMSYTPEGQALSYNASYSVNSLDELAALNAKRDSWINEGLSRLTPDMNEAKKAKILQDYVAEKLTYPEHEEIYMYPVKKGIEEGIAVCEGYTRIYQMMLNKAGLFCSYYSGSALNSNSIFGHAWNLAYLDGQYGWIDATWNDNGSTSGTAYFGLSTEDFKRSHEFYSQYTYENYPTPNWNY